MSGTDFVANLPSFTRFSDVADPLRFAPAPEGWRVYCCDVLNSTEAIREGRYKAVNMMGAACIMAAINAASGIELAYVFGGDGATILAPDCLASAINRALTRTRRLARDEFNLVMRVGSVSLGEIRSRGADLRVAMFELSPGNRVAMFTGGGAALADRLVKCDDTGAYAITDLDNERPDLKGLSCRWEMLAARHGCMMCVLAYATPEQADARARIYGALIAGIEQALQPDIDAARPVRTDNMRFRWPPRGLGLEAAATCVGRPRWPHTLALATESFLQATAEWFDLRIGDYHAPVYRREVRANSDYRRFDDVLRLVLDCTPVQRRAIEEVLAAAHRRGDIVYGMHPSASALITCLLFGLKDSRHLHFIDGTDGGFTFAARAMKAQVAATCVDASTVHRGGPSSM